MRFEPKIVRPSEAVPDPIATSGDRGEPEAGLPDELAVLAAQLQDDAAHLAALYPAGCTSDVSPEKTVGNALCGAAEKRPSRKASAWVVAGTLASVLLILAIALPWFIPGSAWNVTNKHEADPSDLAAGESEREPGEQMLSPSDPSPAAISTPALFLQSVSGPELEGLFDLWEADAVEQSRISI